MLDRLNNNINLIKYSLILLFFVLLSCTASKCFVEILGVDIKYNKNFNNYKLVKDSLVALSIAGDTEGVQNFLSFIDINSTICIKIYNNSVKKSDVKNFYYLHQVSSVKTILDFISKKKNLVQICSIGIDPQINGFLYEYIESVDSTHYNFKASAEIVAENSFIIVENVAYCTDNQLPDAFLEWKAILAGIKVHH